MLNMNIDKNIILKITGIRKKEIEEIEKENSYGK